MLIIPGAAGRDTCDRPARITRRELLRVGGSSMLGLSLAQLLGIAEKHDVACRAGDGDGVAQRELTGFVYRE